MIEIFFGNPANLIAIANGWGNQSKDGKKYVGAWNFGPSLQQNLQVIKFAKMFKKKMNSKSKIVIKRNFGKIKNKKIKVFESKNLSIDSRKVYKFLNPYES